MFYPTTTERYVLDSIFELSSFVTLPLCLLTLYFLLFKESQATKTHRFYMINICLSSQLCDLLCSFMQPLFIVPYGAFYGISPIYFPRPWQLIGFTIYVFVLGNIMTTLQFSAIYKVQLIFLDWTSWAKFFRRKAYLITFLAIIVFFLVISLALNSNELCMGSFVDCQFYFDDDVLPALQSELVVLVFRKGPITTYGSIFAVICFLDSSITYAILSFLILLRTKTLESQLHLSKEAIEMQRYFFVIFLFQSIDIFLCVLLPFFMLCLAIAGIDVFPEIIVAAPSLFMYLHSALNSLIIIFPTHSYRKIVSSWFRILYFLCVKHSRKNVTKPIIVVSEANTVALVIH